MKVLTSVQMREAERLTADTAGISTLRLMENAGAAAARIIAHEKSGRKRRCAVVCGKGGNGGDGVVTALRLREAGFDVSVVLSHGKPSHADSLYVYSRLIDAGIKTVDWNYDAPVCAALISGAHFLIDAIFGVGFRGGVDESTGDLIDCINHAGVPVYSLDVPSGVEADSGEHHGDFVNADVTIVFSQPKPVHVLRPCGKIHIVDIGIPDRIVDSFDTSVMLTDREFVRSVLPKRAIDAHKGDCGRLLAICGSYTMPGAAIMCSHAAVKSGVGLVTLAISESAYPFVAGKTNEPVYLPLPCAGNKTDGVVAARLIANEMRRSDCIVIGCGLTRDDSLMPLLYAVLTQADCPVVLDADGINLLSRNKYLIEDISAPLVITPHTGELSRLCGLTVDEIKSDRISAAKSAAAQFNATVVLKGSRTLIASPDGTVWCNLNGNPGMATAGSGDVLSGIVGSLIAQGVSPHDAAVAAVYIHGAAGDICAERLTQYCTTPTDMIAALPEVFSIISE